MKNQEKKGLKYWLDILKANTRAFFKHPIQFTRDYIASFKTLDTKGKIKKALLTIAGIWVAYITIGLALVALFCFSFIDQPFTGMSEAEKDVAADTKAREKTYAEGGSYYQHYDDIRGSM